MLPLCAPSKDTGSLRNFADRVHPAAVQVCLGLEVRSGLVTSGLLEMAAFVAIEEVKYRLA